MIRCAGLALCLVLACGAAQGQTPGPDAERVLPDWLSAEGSLRLRYETLDGRFRAGRTGSDQMLSTLATVKVGAELDRLGFGLELSDARAFFEDSGTALSSTAVNTAEILQAYAWIDLDRLGVVQAGRFTMNIGSRRLAGRNSFRNHPSNFEGLRYDVRGAGWDLTAAYTAPVIRKPSDFAALHENRAELDEADWDVRFWALHATRADLPASTQLSVYVFGLDQADGADILTPGLRLWRTRAPGEIDYELEVMAQTGELANPVPGAAALDVRAASTFAGLGRTFGGPWSPRLSAQYVYASGDTNPGDGRAGRFNPLFGLRRGDLGQSGLFGPLDRENISAPGLRLEVARQAVDAHILYQAVWLASDTDRWRVAGLRDVSGRSGRFVGQIIDTRMRAWLVPRTLQLEAGVSVLFKGGFATDAPGAPSDDTALFSYVSLTRTF